MEFSYIAKNELGQTIEGVVIAGNQEAAIEILHQKKLIILELNEKKESIIEKLKKIHISGGSNKEFVAFLRSLATLFGAGVSLVTTLKILTDKMKPGPLKSACEVIINDVNAGVPFSTALSSHPNIFSPLYIRMIESAEVSGRLVEVLNYIADNSERQYDLSGKIKSALMYPIVLVFAAIIIGFLMMLYVIPQLTNILQESGAAIPLPTQILIAVSGFIVRRWYVIFGGIILIVVFLTRYFSTEKGSIFKDKTILRVPVFGPLFKYIYLNRFAENFSNLIQSGIPIIQALDIVSKIIGNRVYINILNQIKEKVKAGGSMSDEIDKHPNEMPVIVKQLIEVGEKTGKLDYVLGVIAKFYQKEIERIINNLTQLIEPVLILFLGVIIAGLVAAILLPIYSIGSGSF